VNDAPEICSPEVTMTLFADDTKLFSSLRDVSERFILQQNLDKFASWASTWQLQISEEKCNVLTIGNMSEPPSYVLNGKTIKVVSSCRDLGIQIDQNCLFKQHITNICKKAYAIINVLFRCFETNCVDSLVNAYKAIMRPTIEYCSCVWSPFLNAKHYLGLTDQIENVQRYFTRRVFRRCHLGHDGGYIHRLEMLHLESLELRRVKADLCMVYKLLHGIVDVPPNSLLNQHSSYYEIRGHSKMKLSKNLVKTNVALNMFTNRVVNVWNGLPNNIVQQSSLPAFKLFLSSSYDLSSVLKFDRNF
jgi:hypothetical protein